MHRFFACLALTIAYLLTLTAPSQHAQGQTYNWTNASGGAYNVAGNWNPSGPPTALSTVGLQLNAIYTINFTANAQASTLLASQGEVTLALDGSKFQLSNTANNGLGSSVAPSLRILNGQFQPGNFIVASASGQEGTLILDAGSVTTIGSGVFYVGASGGGTLNIQGGGVLNTSASTALGTNASGVGVATVAGAGSTWNAATTLKIGEAGTGSLSVINGGSVTANAVNVGELSSSVGSLTVSGAGATFSTAGTANIGGASANFPAASATVNVGPGGAINFGGTTNLRTSAAVNVTGGTLKLNVVNAAVGAKVNWSAGTIQFANGSNVNANLLNLLLDGTHKLGANRTLAATAGTLALDSSLLVDGGTINAPNIDVNAGLKIGQFGAVTASDSLNIGAGKTVEIDNFGTLAATNLIMNNGGVLQLNGPNATVNGFFVNDAGVVQGTGRFAAGMNNSAQGIVRAKEGEHLIIDGFGMSNPGVIELKGGTVEYATALSNMASGVITGRGTFRGGTSNSGGLGVSNAGVMAFSGGTTDVHGDVLNAAGGKIVAAGGSVLTFYDDVVHNGAEIRTNAGSRTVFFGSQTGAGAFTGSGVVEFNGDLRPGNSPANVSMGGDVEFGATATLHVELGGMAKGAGYDAVTIAGEAALGGGLDVKLINGFTPTWGDSFEILTAAGGISGLFSNVTLPPLPGLLFWTMDADADSIALQVDAPSLPGDFDHNGVVEGTDLAQWKGDMGANGDSDADGDGDSDGADFLVWQQNFGLNVFGSPSVQAVPEPACGVLLACGVATLVGAFRCKRLNKTASF